MKNKIIFIIIISLLLLITPSYASLQSDSFLKEILPGEVEEFKNYIIIEKKIYHEPTTEEIEELRCMI